MFSRSRPLLCVIATGMSFGAQQPTARHASDAPHQRTSPLHRHRTIAWQPSGGLVAVHRLKEFAAPESATWDCPHDLRNV
jgi:hypothetical protein